MKKRIVAVLLSLTMVMTTGVGAVSAADFADETVTAETIDVQPDDSDADTADSAEDSSVDIDTEDGEQDQEDVPLDTEDQEDSSTVVDFSAGEDQTAVSTADADQAAVEDDLDELGAGESVTANKAVLHYTRWKYEPEAAKWKLVKPSTTTMAAADQGAEAVDTAGAADAKSEDVEEATGETAEDDSLSTQSEEETADTDDTKEAEEDSTDAAGTTSYYTSEFVNVDTIDESGKVVSSGTYYFDENGYLVTGYRSLKGYSYFFMNAADAKITGTLKATEAEDGKAPFNSNLGQVQKHTWIWITNAFHLFGDDGREATFETGKLYEIGKGKYYTLNADGVPVVGDKKINGNLYTFLPKDTAAGRKYPGLMASNQWVSRKVGSKTQWRFFQKNGVYKKMGVGAYKLLSTSSNLYLVDANGYILKDTMAKAANGGVYLSNTKGVIYRNTLVKRGGFRYFFQGDGTRANFKNRWVKIKSAGNRYYYFGKTYGRVQEKTGYQKVTVNNKFVGWFYFSKKGNNVQNQWVGKKYFLADGRMASGVTKVGSKYYFFQRSSTSAYRGDRYANTWIKYQNKYYYAYSDGTLAASGWKRLTVDGKKYWFYFKNCVAQTNRTATRGTTKGYLDSRGKFVNGWIVVDSANNKVRYIDPSTGTYAKNKVLKIDGKYYRFDSKGYRVSDRTAEYKQSSYYVTVDKTNGVMTVYTDSSMQIPIKTVRVSVGNPTSLTPNGTYTINRAGRWQELMGPSWGQYGSHVVGGIYIHSVASGLRNANNLPAGEYLKLGSPASHGCIRCCVADAKWMWENCNGSKIYIFNGKYQSDNALKGPLGRKPLTPLRGSKTFDPTDPLMAKY